MKIWLTGARGLVGKNILESPEAKKYEWVSPNRSELDLFDFAAVDAFVKKERPDFIIHCAGRVGGIQANMAHPVEFLVENTDIGRNVIMAAMKNEVPRLFNLASSCVYPRNAENPLRETQILQGELEPTNEGYALGKIFALRLCQYITRTKPSLKYKTLIPCNLYGRFDKFDPKASHLVPAIIRKIHEAKVTGAPSVDIWGDGTARREFLLASDLTDQLMKALNCFDEVPELMNVGVGRDYSIKEYYEVCKRVIGYQGDFTFDLSKPAGMKQKLTDVSLSEKLGIRSTVSLEEGVRQTYQFFLEEVLAKQGGKA
jgi:GDP-L-fucose synthase